MPIDFRPLKKEKKKVDFVPKMSRAEAIKLGVLSGLTENLYPYAQASLSPEGQKLHTEEYQRNLPQPNYFFKGGPPLEKTGFEHLTQEQINERLKSIQQEKMAPFKEAEANYPYSYGASDIITGGVRDIGLTAAAGAVGLLPKLSSSLTGAKKVATMAARKVFPEMALGGTAAAIRAPEGQRKEAFAMGSILGAVIPGITTIGKKGFRKVGTLLTGINEAVENRFKLRSKQIKNGLPLYDSAEKVFSKFNFMKEESKRMSGESRKILSKDAGYIPIEKIKNAIDSGKKILYDTGDHVSKEGKKIIKKLDELKENVYDMANGQIGVDAGYLKTIISKLRFLAKFNKETYGDIAVNTFRKSESAVNNLAKDLSSAYKHFMNTKLAPLTSDLSKLNKRFKTVDSIHNAAKKFISGKDEGATRDLILLNKVVGSDITEELEDSIAREIIYGPKISTTQALKTGLVGATAARAGLSKISPELGAQASPLIMATIATRQKFGRPLGRIVLETKTKTSEITGKIWDNVAKKLKLNPNELTPKFAGILKNSDNPLLRHTIMYKYYPEYREIVDKLNNKTQKTPQSKINE